MKRILNMIKVVDCSAKTVKCLNCISAVLTVMTLIYAGLQIFGLCRDAKGLTKE